jgi:L-iditol 2-dehydrogenase
VMCVLGLPDGPTLEVPWGVAMNRALDVTFSLSSSWSSWDAALALMARGALDPAPLATVYPLPRWQDAFGALADRTVVKALLDPREPPQEHRNQHPHPIRETP